MINIRHVANIKNETVPHQVASCGHRTLSFFSKHEKKQKTLKTKETNMADLVEGPDRGKSQGRFG